MFYVECLEAGALQAFLRGVGTLLIFERPDLHAVVLVFVRRLHVRGEMFSLQAADQGLRVILPRESSNLQNNRAIGNQRGEGAEFLTFTCLEGGGVGDVFGTGSRCGGTFEDLSLS